MGRSDWEITGVGGYGIIDFGGSKRLQLSGYKQLIWLGNSNLSNSEIIAETMNSNGANNNNGFMLRSDAIGNNCYRLAILNARMYQIQKIVSGVVTILGTVSSTQAYNIWVKTRFRVDGWQLSVEEWIGNQWVTIKVCDDTEHSFPSGRVGIFSTNINTSYYGLFDNIQIGKRD